MSWYKYAMEYENEQEEKARNIMQEIYNNNK